MTLYTCKLWQYMKWLYTFALYYLMALCTLHSRCTLWHYMNYGKEQVLAKLYAVQYTLQDITYLANSGAALKTVSSLFKSMNSSTTTKAWQIGFVFIKNYYLFSIPRGCLQTVRSLFKGIHSWKNYFQLSFNASFHSCFWPG